MKVYGRHHHHHENPWDEAPPWAIELGHIVGLLLANTEKIMSTIEDFEATLTAIDGKVATVKTDVETLIAKLAAIPPGGLTPAQQAAIDGAVVHAQKIATDLGGIDTEVNPAP